MAAQYLEVEFTVSTAGISGDLSLEGMTAFALVTSTALTGTSITLQASRDESTFYDMYTSDGTELTFTVGASQHVVFQNPEYFLGVKGLRVRTGPSSAASTQAAIRTMQLLCRGL